MSETVSWSYTTVNTLRQCNRKYFFYAVMATHGRKTAARRKAYELKQMQTLQMWQGSVVDKFMEKRLIPAITARQTLDFTAMAEHAVAMAVKQFDFSLYKKYLDPALKKGDIDEEFCILDIHELSKPYEAGDIERCYGVIREAVLRIPTIHMPDGQPLVDYLKIDGPPTAERNGLGDLPGAREGEPADGLTRVPAMEPGRNGLEIVGQLQFRLFQTAADLRHHRVF